MKTLLKMRDVLRNIVELYIPIASFAIMFLVFIAQIFCRYILRMPLAWAYEVTVSCYLWLVILGACYAQRHHSHVTFTLITDIMPLRLQAFAIFLGNLLIGVTFAWSFIPSVNFVQFMQAQTTAVFKIGLNFVYCPYIAFLAIHILYMLHDVILDFKVFTGLASEDEIALYKRENMNEVEHALAGDEEGGSAE